MPTIEPEIHAYEIEDAEQSIQQGLGFATEEIITAAEQIHTLQSILGISETDLQDLSIKIYKQDSWKYTAPEPEDDNTDPSTIPAKNRLIVITIDDNEVAEPITAAEVVATQTPPIKHTCRTASPTTHKAPTHYGCNTINALSKTPYTPPLSRLITAHNTLAEIDNYNNQQPLLETPVKHAPYIKHINTNGKSQYQFTFTYQHVVQLKQIIDIMQGARNPGAAIIYALRTLQLRKTLLQRTIPPITAQTNTAAYLSQRNDYQILNSTYDLANEAKETIIEEALNQLNCTIFDFAEQYGAVYAAIMSQCSIITQLLQTLRSHHSDIIQSITQTNHNFISLLRNQEVPHIYFMQQDAINQHIRNLLEWKVAPICTALNEIQNIIEEEEPAIEITAYDGTPTNNTHDIPTIRLSLRAPTLDPDEQEVVIKPWLIHKLHPHTAILSLVEYKTIKPNKTFTLDIHIPITALPHLAKSIKSQAANATTYNESLLKQIITHNAITTPQDETSIRNLFLNSHNIHRELNLIKYVSQTNGTKEHYSTALQEALIIHTLPYNSSLLFSHTANSLHEAIERFQNQVNSSPQLPHLINSRHEKRPPAIEPHHKKSWLTSPPSDTIASIVNGTIEPILRQYVGIDTIHHNSLMYVQKNNMILPRQQIPCIASIRWLSDITLKQHYGKIQQIFSALESNSILIDHYGYLPNDFDSFVLPSAHNKTYAIQGSSFFPSTKSDWLLHYNLLYKIHQALQENNTVNTFETIINECIKRNDAMQLMPELHTITQSLQKFIRHVPPHKWHYSQDPDNKQPDQIYIKIADTTSNELQNKSIVILMPDIESKQYVENLLAHIMRYMHQIFPCINTTGATALIAPSTTKDICITIYLNRYIVPIFAQCIKAIVSRITSQPIPRSINEQEYLADIVSHTTAATRTAFTQLNAAKDIATASIKHAQLKEQPFMLLQHMLSYGCLLETIHNYQKLSQYTTNDETRKAQSASEKILTHALHNHILNKILQDNFCKNSLLAENNPGLKSIRNIAQNIFYITTPSTAFNESPEECIPPYNITLEPNLIKQINILASQHPVDARGWQALYSAANNQEDHTASNTGKPNDSTAETSPSTTLVMDKTSPGIVQTYIQIMRT